MGSEAFNPALEAILATAVYGAASPRARFRIWLREIVSGETRLGWSLWRDVQHEAWRSALAEKRAERVAEGIRRASAAVAHNRPPASPRTASVPPETT